MPLCNWWGMVEISESVWETSQLRETGSLFFLCPFPNSGILTKSFGFLLGERKLCSKNLGALSFLGTWRHQHAGPGGEFWGHSRS